MRVRQYARSDLPLGQKARSLNTAFGGLPPGKGVQPYMYYYRGVKIELLKIEQMENGNWGGRFQLTWVDGSKEDFCTKRECPTEDSAKESAENEVCYYIDQQKGPVQSRA